MKKTISLILLTFMILGMFASCSSTSSESVRDDGKSELPTIDGNDTDSAHPETEITPPDRVDDEEDDDPITETPTLPDYGNTVGTRFFDLVLEGINVESVNTKDYRGKLIIFNVWGTWCGPCKSELPDFDRIASEYADDVVVIAAHSCSYRSTAAGYVNTNFPNTNILFAYDTESEAAYYSAGGELYYPRTAIIDRNGVIVYAQDGAMSYDTLSKIIEAYK